MQVDLDVAGTKNSLLFTSTAQETITQPWFEDDWGSEVIQQKISKTFIENEDDALLKLPLNFQGGYSIVNRDEHNSWGISRGYAIHPGYSPIYNVRHVPRVGGAIRTNAPQLDRRWLQTPARER